MRRKALFATLALVLVTPSLRADEGDPGWLDKCRLVRSTHKADIFANCPKGHGGRWRVPALFNNGVRVHPRTVSGTPGTWDGYSREQAYYRNDVFQYGQSVRRFPKGFTMRTSRRTASVREVYWNCSDNSNTPYKARKPPDCDTGVLAQTLGFASCWDGVHQDTAHRPRALVFPPYDPNLRSWDSSGHGAGRCPAHHPVYLPRVILRLEYPVGTDSGGVTIATRQQRAYYRNTWDADTLRYLIKHCLNVGIDCGTFGR